MRKRWYRASLTSRTSRMRPYQSNPLYMPGRIINTVKTADKLSRTDSLLSVLRSFKYYCPTALGPTIRPNVDVGADDVARGPE